MRRTFLITGYNHQQRAHICQEAGTDEKVLIDIALSEPLWSKRGIVAEMQALIGKTITLDKLNSFLFLASGVEFLETETETQKERAT